MKYNHFRWCAESNQEKIVEAGGLSSLLILLRSSEDETIHRVAAGAIANLAMNGDLNCFIIVYACLSQVVHELFQLWFREPLMKFFPVRNQPRTHNVSRGHYFVVNDSSQCRGTSNPPNGCWSHRESVWQW